MLDLGFSTVTGQPSTLDGWPSACYRLLPSKFFTYRLFPNRL